MFEKVIADAGIDLKALTISSTKSFLFLMLDLFFFLIIILFIGTIIYVFSRWNKQVRWLLTPLIWFKNIIDPQWWAEKIFYKLKLDRLANNPWRRWVESLPMKKRIALELFFFLPILILVDEYILMPYIGMAILPWNWDWSGG